MEKFCDEYCATFSAEQLEEFTDAVKDLVENSSWIPGIPSRTIRVEGMTPIETPIVSNRTGIPHDVVADTAYGTLLLAEFAGETQCVRDTAVQTLEDTAKISGIALSRVEPENLATILNLALDVARGNSLILKQYGKASAFLSGSTYCVMRQDMLLQETLESLENQFGDVTFKEGYIDHGFTRCAFVLDEMRDEIAQSYEDALGPKGKQIGEVIPCVEFKTSDVGACAATLQPYFIVSGLPVTFADPIKVEHKHTIGEKEEGVDLFRTRSHELFGLFKNSTERITQMDNITVSHPRNALIGICKRLNLPKKYGAMAEAKLTEEIGSAPCSFYDLYLYIANMAAYAKAEQKSDRELWRLNEAISRVVTLNIHDFDLPGTFAW